MLFPELRLFNSFRPTVGLWIMRPQASSPQLQRVCKGLVQHSKCPDPSHSQSTLGEDNEINLTPTFVCFPPSFCDRVSPCSPGWPRNFLSKPTGLKLTWHPMPVLSFVVCLVLRVFCTAVQAGHETPVLVSYVLGLIGRDQHIQIHLCHTKRLSLETLLHKHQLNLTAIFQAYFNVWCSS